MTTIFEIQKQSPSHANPYIKSVAMTSSLRSPSVSSIHLMEKFRRGSAPARQNAGSVASSSAEQRKRPSIGRAAGSLHSKIAAPFKSGKKKVDQSEDGEEST
jgi:hypothetical protein